MDRCTTPAIIETFEAIRLFLHAPKSAYVVGAHEEIVEAALEGRYPARKGGDEDLGRHYLEKMLQNSITIPPLSEPEAQTYINLLFAELYASDEQFAKLRAGGRREPRAQPARGGDERGHRDAMPSATCRTSSRRRSNSPSASARPWPAGSAGTRVS